MMGTAQCCSIIRSVVAEWSGIQCTTEVIQH